MARPQPDRGKIRFALVSLAWYTRPMTKNESTATITINIATEFTVDEIWPDGDAPANPTAKDVAAVIASNGGATVRVVRDWCMEMDWTWTVNVDAPGASSATVIQ